MELLFYILSIITVIILVIYVWMISLFLIRWNAIEEFDLEQNQAGLKTTVSIIVAARNEEENILSLLKCIAAQNYPASLFEVLIVDDHSEDHTIELTAAFIEEHQLSNFKLLELAKINPALKNKKAALMQGIKHSAGELIITTDADCNMGEYWISHIVAYYEKYNAQMIVAPVLLSGESFFDKLQRFEFLSLIAVTASTINAGKPLMCNGANLTYSRKIFNETGGFESNYQFATGDDTFLMFKILELNSNYIHFLKSNNAVVITPAQKNISSFLNQRLRWASKTTHYHLKHVAVAGYFLASINLLIILLIFLSLYEYRFLVTAILLFIIKSIIDIWYLYQVAFYFRQRSLFNLWVIFITTLVYPFYILFISIKSRTAKYNWKGRQFQNPSSLTNSFTD